MTRPTLVLILLAAALSAGGCALFGKKEVKPSDRIYVGDGPSIKMTERESAGGRLNPR